MSQQNMYIDGEWPPALSGDTRVVINPHDASEIGRVAEGGRADAELAIQAARRAFDEGDWPRRPVADRVAFLRRLAVAVREHTDELARLETLDTGKTLAESVWDMEDVAGVFEYYADLGGRDHEETLTSPNPDSTSRLVREPVGVCAQICPWNYPLLQASWKLAPALVSGCTVVLKPSELTPLTTLRLTELAHEVGLPGGVLNTVLGPGPTVGAELAESPAVDLVSFTGGVQTGQTIMQAASGNLKRVALELGGKNPHIIFDDADLDVALDHALNAVFFHAGQVCSAGARLLLQDGICDAFTERLLERMKRIRLGSGLESSTQMGPLISAEHRAAVADRVAAAQVEGARLVLGGGAPEDEALQGGFYYLPTLFTHCTHDMRAVREEIFGPVITVERFHTEEEAVRWANDTEYGLTAGFRTRDPERIQRLSRALRFGTVWVNDYNVYFAEAPWGGFKRSGIGRELGRAGLDEYTELKHVYESHAPAALDWFGA
ncbi:MAG: aldehyde dehydrogenase family protein [Myxococcota bacterium]|nr:aldehyde dehydrogenase family protein [Myxococcota bacterium]